jgi:zinc transport system substrate-binding protein
MCTLAFGAACGPGASPAPSASAAASVVPAAPAASGSFPTGAPAAALPKGQALVVGVTLHPYFSWVKNVVGDAPGVEVRSILPGDVDIDNYQPAPADIAKIGGLSAIVVNAIGHDDVVAGMIRAANAPKLVVLRANDATPTIKSAHGPAPNAHTFISFTNAVQQTYAIAKTLGALRPALAETFQSNAEAYAKRLRAIKSAAAEKLANAKTKRVVTVHDGYAYLCQEFGVEVAGVVQPAHGLVPSAAELGQMAELLKREKIQVVLTEEGFPEKMLDVLKKEAPVRVYIISHVATGAYTAEKYEQEMQKNVDTLVQALVTDG